MSAIKTILIVDDEPNVRLVFRTALEQPSYRLATAEDGETALRWLETTPVDLVLLDLQMPEIDGMEVLRRLRGSGNGVPVVVVTAHGSVPHAVEAMKLGAIDFLSKPLSPQALRQTVAEVLARHEPPPPAAPTSPEAEFEATLSLAKKALNRRDFDLAKASLTKALALRDGSAEAHNLLGVLHELKGQHDESYRAYRRALKADRRYEPAQHNMRRYYERFTFGRSDVPIDQGDPVEPPSRSEP